MMSQPNATPYPRYKVEDVEELMTLAAAMLERLEDGTLTAEMPFTQMTEAAIEACDKLEQVLDRMRQAVLEAIPAGARPRLVVPVPISIGFIDVCEQIGVTPADVLGGFVADVTGDNHDEAGIGYVCGGSDERDQAFSYAWRRNGYVRLALDAA